MTYQQLHDLIEELPDKFKEKDITTTIGNEITGININYTYEGKLRIQLEED